MGRLLSILSVAAVVLLAAACEGGGEPVTEPPLHHSPARITSIEVSPAALGMRFGDTVTMTATVLDQHGDTVRDAPIYWSSGAISVASVTGEGLVTAFGYGTTQVVAAAGSVADTSSVTVSYIIVEPPPFTISPVNITLSPGESVQLHLGGRAADFPVTWTFDTDGVIQVDERYLMTALRTGTTNARAIAASGRSSQIYVTVR